MRHPAPLEVYQRLHSHYGDQNWWPAESPFEMMVGAILTQNTRWENVEDAIQNLKNANVLNPESIVSCDTERLETLIRPSGFFRQKSKYLIAFSNFFLAHNGIHGLKGWATQCLRARLLKIQGVGPETADSMLLYAFDKPVFVVDAYTKRIFSRLGLFEATLSYDDVQNFFFQRLSNSLQLFQEFHALIVKHAKKHCSSKPQCDDCPLFDMCETVCETDRLSEL